MIKKITKKVLKEVVEVESEIGICDICGKEFNYEPWIGWIGNDKVARYYHIVTGHNDWGNDSCESIEYHDFCCAECAKKFVNEYIDEAGGINNINTKYITINHCNTLNDGYYI